ncbi:hypothetical protein Pden_0086 [Paracoccus denitrificans PD1222]|uniref:Uncharacterized protein n=1 Tax=Paracoccus denitrificans (strain Pd 1222) TaxID=318586 RepID=A1AY59_PARDP|nr:hypothetical protein Pden_0086 [Paracoccus denitrificans PD1222]
MQRHPEDQIGRKDFLPNLLSQDFKTDVPLQSASFPAAGGAASPSAMMPCPIRFRLAQHRDGRRAAFRSGAAGISPPGRTVAPLLGRSPAHR